MGAVLTPNTDASLKPVLHEMVTKRYVRLQQQHQHRHLLLLVTDNDAKIMKKRLYAQYLRELNPATQLVSLDLPAKERNRKDEVR